MPYYLTALNTVTTKHGCHYDSGGQTELSLQGQTAGQQTGVTAVLCGSGCCASSNYPVTALLFECVAVLLCC